MRSRIANQNHLQQRIESGDSQPRSRLKKTIENVNFDFPKLDLDDLILLFFSSYKIKQAPAYVEEHFDEDSDYLIEIEDEKDLILRCTIQSRHSNSVKYKTWIKYSFTNDPIESWYCTCASGAMTVGACSHVVSIVWYLSYARHENFSPSLGRRRVQQAVMERIVELESNDEESDETEDEG
ncbi:unnamed protein product [Adineta steineri]|uniref:SWIM-type domain-containing protein n=1 Tax=Adineta steineri TaxID=433720 RepID=A0A819VYU4_9BILA|nr:unnamed protein product [Adineta steineri]CAF4115905.1 unnamed protein product [Adineta steineri]